MLWIYVEVIGRPVPLCHWDPWSQGGRHCHVQRWASTHFCENTEFGLRPRQFSGQGMAEIAVKAVMQIVGFGFLMAAYKLELYFPKFLWSFPRPHSGRVKFPVFAAPKSPFFLCEIPILWSCDPRWTKLVTPCCMASTPSWQKTELEPREPLPSEVMKFWQHSMGWKQQIWGEDRDFYHPIPFKER